MLFGLLFVIINISLINNIGNMVVCGGVKLLLERLCCYSLYFLLLLIGFLFLMVDLSEWNDKFLIIILIINFVIFGGYNLLLD